MAKEGRTVAHARIQENADGRSDDFEMGRRKREKFDCFVFGDEIGVTLE